MKEYYAILYNNMLLQSICSGLKERSVMKLGVFNSLKNVMENTLNNDSIFHPELHVFIYLPYCSLFKVDK